MQEFSRGSFWQFRGKSAQKHRTSAFFSGSSVARNSSAWKTSKRSDREEVRILKHQSSFAISRKAQFAMIVLYAGLDKHIQSLGCFFCEDLAQALSFAERYSCQVEKSVEFLETGLKQLNCMLLEARILLTLLDSDLTPPVRKKKLSHLVGKVGDLGLKDVILRRLMTECMSVVVTPK